MAKIVLEIENCLICPNCEETRTPHAGHAFDYYCKLTGDKTSGYVESPKEIKPVPNSCPILFKES